MTSTATTSVLLLNVSAVRVAFGIFYGVLLFPLMGLGLSRVLGHGLPHPHGQAYLGLAQEPRDRPLALHFRSAPGMDKQQQHHGEIDEIAGAAKKFFLPLKPGEPAPRPKSINAAS